jgi:hypothetical protein
VKTYFSLQVKVALIITLDNLMITLDYVVFNYWGKLEKVGIKSKMRTG